MISYAQNFEDVILARVFSSQTSGFYVDIGTWDAVRDSVTKHFYDSGWFGINVEALPSHFERIKTARLRDININVAIGTKPDPATFFEINDTGLSTLHREYAELHAKQGFGVSETTVPVLRLESVLDEHAKGQTIDFLKIDVEGAELDVIRSGNWQRHRPRVLLVEATLPRSPIASFADWEPLLVESGFIFVYFDGLNRWYVREEDRELEQHFAIPPNVFDDFVPAQLKNLQSDIDELKVRLQSSMRKANRWDRFRGSLIGRTIGRWY